MTSFQIGRAIEVGELRVTVVERTSIDPQPMERGVLVEARKEPYAVLVRKADATYAIGMDGAHLSTSQLAEDVPDLAT